MNYRSTETVELAVLAPLPPSTSTITSIARASPTRIGNVNSTPNIHDASDNHSQTSASTTPIASSLAPVDGGFGAWSFLTAAFFVEAIAWGFPDAFGVFLNAYLNDESSGYAKQKNAASMLPLIGPLSSGIIFLSELVFLQGVMYGIGGSLLYAPCTSYAYEWFVARRGLAIGIIFSGTAVGGIVLPILLSQLIEKYGPTKTLRMLAIAVGCLLIPLLPFIKPRIPVSRVSGPVPRSTDRSWMKSRAFWFLLAANTIQGFGYFVPILWIPTFATDLKLGSTQSSAVLAVLSAASFIGRTGMGVLSDRFNPWLLVLTTLTCSSIATFVLWGVLSHTYGGLMAFGAAYGVLAGGWPSLWAGFIGPISKDDPFLATTLFSYLLCSRGIGNVFSTPISTRLVRYGAGSWADGKNIGFNVGEGRFEWLIVFVGTCFAGAALIAFAGWTLEFGARERRGRA